MDRKGNNIINQFETYVKRIDKFIASIHDHSDDVDKYENNIPHDDEKKKKQLRDIFKKIFRSKSFQAGYKQDYIWGLLLNKLYSGSDPNTYKPNQNGNARINDLVSRLDTTMQDLDTTDDKNKNFKDTCNEFVKQLSSIDKEKTDLLTLKDELISELSQLN